MSSNNITGATIARLVGDMTWNCCINPHKRQRGKLWSSLPSLAWEAWSHKGRTCPELSILWTFLPISLMTIFLFLHNSTGDGRHPDRVMQLQTVCGLVKVCSAGMIDLCQISSHLFFFLVDDKDFCHSHHTQHIPIHQFLHCKEGVNSHMLRCNRILQIMSSWPWHVKSSQNFPQYQCQGWGHSKSNANYVTN